MPVFFPIKQQTNLANGATARVVIHFTGAVAANVVVVPGNNSVSNLAVSTENVASAVITKIFWTGNTLITRGSNTIFSSQAGTSGMWDLESSDIALNALDTANLVVTTTDTLIFEVRKKVV